MGLPSLFFCVDVQHAHDLSAVLRENSIKVYPISGKTPTNEENRLYRLFSEGEIDGLASCGVLCEGYDAPHAMGAFLCRPTKSGLLYRQMVGRVLRPYPAPEGKRGYQEECLAAILSEASVGVAAQLVVMPTGTGKTYIANHLPWVIEQWKGRRMGRLAFFVHRDNLVEQAADSFRQWCPRLTVGVEKGGGHYAGDADIVVGSVQSLGTTKDGQIDNARLRRFSPDQFDCVVIDEAHHACRGVQYATIMRWFRVLKGDKDRDPTKLLLLITATPSRADNIGMEVIADKIVYEYPLRQAVSEKYLSEPRAFRIETEVTLEGVHTTAGDFNVGELSHTVNTPIRNELVAREYLKIRDLAACDVTPESPKPYCVIADFVDVSGRHSLITLPTLFGLRATFDAKGKDIIEVVEEIEKLEAEHPGLDLRSAPNLEAVKTTLHKLDLLQAPTTPPEIRKISRFVWLQETTESYRLGIFDGAMLSVRVNTLGQWDVYRHVKGVRTKLWAAHSLKEAVQQAEKEIPYQDAKVMAAEASWRREPPTLKQAGRLITLNHKLRQEFRTADALHAFLCDRHGLGDLACSRGGVSRKIDALSGPR